MFNTRKTLSRLCPPLPRVGPPTHSDFCSLFYPMRCYVVAEGRRGFGEPTRSVIAAHFDYRGGSIGNFMLTGARLFFSSLEAPRDPPEGPDTEIRKFTITLFFLPVPLHSPKNGVGNQGSSSCHVVFPSPQSRWVCMLSWLYRMLSAFRFRHRAPWFCCQDFFIIVFSISYYTPG